MLPNCVNTHRSVFVSIMRNVIKSFHVRNFVSIMRNEIKSFHVRNFVSIMRNVIKSFPVRKCNMHPKVYLHQNSEMIKHEIKNQQKFNVIH